MNGQIESVNTGVKNVVVGDGVCSAGPYEKVRRLAQEPGK